MLLPPAQPAQPPSSLAVLWQMLGRVVANLAAQGAHADVIVTIKAGKVQVVRVHQTFLPNQLPRL